MKKENFLMDNIKKKLVMLINSFNEFIKKIKGNLTLYIFTSILFTGAVVLTIIGNNSTYDGKIENLSYQISEFNKTTNNDDNTTLFTVCQGNDSDNKMLKVGNKYKYLGNGGLNPLYELNKCYIGINSKLSESFFVKNDSEENYKPISVLFPNVFSYKDKTNEIIGNDDLIPYYKMDDMDLYFKYKKPSFSGNWCIISSNIAETKANEMNLDSPKDVIGKTINVRYSVSGEFKDEAWIISGIYDSNLGSANKLTRQYNDFLLSWLIYRNYNYTKNGQLDNISASFELHNSIKSNSSVLKFVLNELNNEKTSYNFLSSAQYTSNVFLNESLENARIKQNNKFFNAYNISSIMLFAALIVIIIYTFFSKNSRNSYVESFVFLNILVSLIFCIIQIITMCLQEKFRFLSFFAFHGSQFLVVIYLLILFYLLSLKLISIYSSNTKKVKNNDEKN